MTAALAELPVLWTSTEAAAATGGRIEGGPWAATGVALDSRQVMPGEVIGAVHIRSGEWGGVLAHEMKCAMLHRCATASRYDACQCALSHCLIHHNPRCRGEIQTACAVHRDA